MKQFAKFLLIAGVAVVVATGCRSAPVYNVEDTSVVTSTGKSVGADEVRKAIIRAGGSLGWVMKEVKPGQLVATLHARKHMAQVDIAYSSKSFSINYKDSAQLDYDGTNIHSNYNGWIQNLQRRITAEMTML